MSRVVVAIAPEPILTASEVKAAIPALVGAGDAVLTGLIAAATQQIDGPSGWLGRAIGMQTLELQRCDFPGGNGWIALPYPPTIGVVSIAYDDTLGVEQTVDPASYHLRGGALALRTGFRWPSTFGDPASVRIRYEAGYAEVPALIKTAVQLMVGSLYNLVRSDGPIKKVVVEGVGSKEYDRVVLDSVTGRAVDALLATLRVWA